MRISDWSSDVCSSDLFNIASGQPRTIESVARDIGRAMGQEIEPSITGERRAGDIRHCLADIDLARSVLDYAPRANFDKGLAELADWVARQSCEDRVVTAWAALASSEERRGGKEGVSRCRTRGSP